MAPLAAYLSYTHNFDSLFKEHQEYSYLRVIIPAVLGINYVKYGESRMIHAMYGIELIVYNKSDTHSSENDIEFEGIYLFSYLKPEANVDEELVGRGFLDVLPR